MRRSTPELRIEPALAGKQASFNRPDSKCGVGLNRQRTLPFGRWLYELLRVYIATIYAFEKTWPLSKIMLSRPFIPMRPTKAYGRPKNVGATAQKLRSRNPLLTPTFYGISWYPDSHMIITQGKWSSVRMRQDVSFPAFKSAALV